MPSYAITGASRGLGLEFTTKLINEGHTVFAIVRNKDQVSKAFTRLVENKSSTKLHVLQANVEDYAALTRAAEEIAKVTDGTLDVLINNAAYQATDTSDRALALTDYPNHEDLVGGLTKSFNANVIGVINTTNAFLPLLRKGSTKKVATLTSILGIPDVTVKTGFPGHALYSVTKSAIDMVTAKYAVALRNEGFIFVGVSPGIVWSAEEPPAPELKRGMEAGGALYKALYPDWQGPFSLTVHESVSMVLKVINDVGPEQSGQILSHYGDKKWL